MSFPKRSMDADCRIPVWSGTAKDCDAAAENVDVFGPLTVPLHH